MKYQDKLQLIKYIMLTLASLILFALFLASAAFDVEIFSKAIDEVSPLLCCVMAILTIALIFKCVETVFKESKLQSKIIDFIYLNEYEIQNLRKDELETLGAIIFKEKGFDIDFTESGSDESFTASTVNKRFYVFVMKTTEMVTAGELREFIMTKDIKRFAGFFNKNIVLINNVYTPAAKELAESEEIQLLGMNEILRLLERMRDQYEANGQ